MSKFDYAIIKRYFNSRGEVTSTAEMGRAVYEDQAHEAAKSLNNTRDPRGRREYDFTVAKVPHRVLSA